MTKREEIKSFITRFVAEVLLEYAKEEQFRKQVDEALVNAQKVDSVYFQSIKMALSFDLVAERWLDTFAWEEDK